MKGTTSVEGLIHRYISDHGLGEGAQLPSQTELVALFGCDAKALAGGLEAALRRGVIAKGPQGDWVVESPLVVSDQESLSFTRSALLHGEQMTTSLHEAALRYPRDDADDPFTTDLESRAHEALGLADGEPFIVITRYRSLHSGSHEVDPMVIHRTFLDPKRFPATFLKNHDFERESMVEDVYKRYGYTIEQRLDAMRARTASPAERADLKIGLGQPVLDLEQRSMARGPDGAEPILLEYLRATYWNITFKFKR